MNATAAAVTLIIVASLILAVMAGIAGFALGRARATDDAKKNYEKDDERLHGTLLGLRSDTVVVSQLLSFTQERAFDYRRIAEDALAYLPDGLRKDILGRELKTTDKKMMFKSVQIEDYRKESKKG